MRGWWDLQLDQSGAGGASISIHAVLSQGTDRVDGHYLEEWRKTGRGSIERKRLCVDHLNQLGRDSVGNTFNKTIETLSIIFKKMQLLEKVSFDKKNIEV